MNNLKSTLLEKGIFSDNKYLDEYVSLIKENIETRPIKYTTNVHHIVPKYYFEDLSIDIDNSSANIVNLEYKDHILAHYYLAMCSIESKDISRNCLAIRFILNGRSLSELSINDIDLNKYQEMYEKSKQYVIQRSHTTEVCKKISNSLLGRVSPNKGNKKDVHLRSTATRDIKNKKLSEYAKQRTGAKNSFYGKKHTDNTKVTIGRKNGKPVAMIDISTGNIINRFFSAHEAARYLNKTGITASSAAVNRILLVCHSNNINSKAYGFNWKFIDKV